MHGYNHQESPTSEMNHTLTKTDFCLDEYKLGTPTIYTARNEITSKLQTSQCQTERNFDNQIKRRSNNELDSFAENRFGVRFENHYGLPLDVHSLINLYSPLNADSSVQPFNQLNTEDTLVNPFNDDSQNSDIPNMPYCLLRGKENENNATGNTSTCFGTYEPSLLIDDQMVGTNFKQKVL